MANVLNRITKELRFSVNTPDFPTSDWIVNPDMSAVAGLPPKFWQIIGDQVTAVDAAQREVIDDDEFIAEATDFRDSPDQTFGDGSDGEIDITAPRVLDGDLYPDILIVRNGQVLSTNGFRIIARRAIIVRGTIEADGKAANGATPGAGAVSGTMGGGGGGAAGGTGIGAAAPDLRTNSAPGYGGDGGKGGDSAGGTGGGGGRTTNTNRVRPRRLETAFSGSDVDFAVSGMLVRFQGGAGGGAGAGNGAASGGGGGGGGGMVVLAAPYIFVGPNGMICAKGGAGGDGASTCGGGGGGGGGVVQMVRAIIRNRGTISVAGGQGGRGPGAGAQRGQDGSPGRIITFKVTLD